MMRRHNELVVKNTERAVSAKKSPAIHRLPDADSKYPA